MKITIIIPTYNERESITGLIDALEEECDKISHHDFSILVVDGNSPDGTASAVQEKKKQYSNLHCISEQEKRGLGSAYIGGMKHAIDVLHAEAFIEMDGDFQHNPKELYRLTEALDQGYDYVIGSRYVGGGSIPSSWSWHRKWLSSGGSLFIKWVLELPTNDNTSGFKLSRVKGFAEKLPLQESKLLSRFHAYKVHLLYEMILLGARVKEVPITFLERKKGSSKSTAIDIIQSLKVVFFLRFRHFMKWRLFKVGLVGLTGFFVQALFFEFVGLQFELTSPRVAAVLGGELAIISNFLLNNRFTFTDQRMPFSKKLFIKFLQFNVGSIFSLGIQWIVVSFGEGVADGSLMTLRGFNVLGVLIGFVANYVIYMKFIWNHKSA